MPLPVPLQRTWSVNDLATAALLNSNVRDSVNFILSVPLCEAYQTTPQSIPNNTNTAVALDTNQIDTYSGHSTTVNNTQYFAQLAGYYIARGLITFASNATGSRWASLAYNGTTIGRSISVCTTVPGGVQTGLVTGTVTQFMNVGDYLQLQATQISGGALSLVGTASVMSLEWVHA